MSRHSSRRRSKRSPLFGLLLIAGVFALIIGAVVALFVFIGMQPERPDSTAVSEIAGAGEETSPPPVPEADSDNPLINLLRAHVVRSGLAEVSSYSMNGKYDHEGERFDLSLIVRRPSSFRQSLRLERSGSLTLTAVATADVEWVEVAASGQEPELQEIDAVNRRLLRMEAGFAALAWSYEDSGLEGLEIVGETSVDGHACTIVENRGLLDVPVRHYIDEEGYEWRREARLSVEDGAKDLVISFGEPVVDDKRIRPAGYRVLIDGEEICVATIESMRTNVGVLPSVFQRPE